MAGKEIRNGNPSTQQVLPHRQQTAVRVAASNGSTLTPKHQIPPEGSTTCSESAESCETSTATNISSRISTSKFAKNEELPRKCLVVRRSAPKQGVTKTEIRLVIYNETQKKEGLRKMEYPALMDASEMLADRLRDLETKSKKDGYEKEKEVRRDLEGERRPPVTPEHQKEVIAKLKKVAPSLCNPSDVTTAEPIDEKSGNTSDSSIQVSPSNNRRKRGAPVSRPPPTTVTPSTTVISDKDLDSIIATSEKSESEPKSKTSNDDSQSKSSSTYSTPLVKSSKKTPKKDKKKRKKKRSDVEDDSDTPVDSVVRYSRQIKDKSAKSPKSPKKAVPTRDSSDRPIRSKLMKKEPPPQSKSDPADESEIILFPTDDSEVQSKPLRKPPPHAIRERKSNKNRSPKKPVEPESSKSRKPKKIQPREEKPKDPIEPSELRRTKRDQPKDEEPKESVEPSRRVKKGRDQPKDEETKEPIEQSEPRRLKKGRDEPKNEEPKESKKPMELLCDRRDCCMQDPCVKKDRKNEKKKEPESDQPTVTEKDEIPSGKRGKKKNKTRTDIVIRDDTSTTNNTNIEDSLYVLKSILKKLESSNSIKLKNNPDKEKVKAQLEKIIKAIEGKLANGTKLNADDLDRMKRIVAKTAELRGTVSLTTTVTVTESISVEDEDTN